MWWEEEVREKEAMHFLHTLGPPPRQVWHGAHTTPPRSLVCAGGREMERLREGRHRSLGASPATTPTTPLLEGTTCSKHNLTEYFMALWRGKAPPLKGQPFHHSNHSSPQSTMIT